MLRTCRCTCAAMSTRTAARPAVSTIETDISIRRRVTLAMYFRLWTPDSDSGLRLWTPKVYYGCRLLSAVLAACAVVIFVFGADVRAQSHAAGDRFVAFRAGT